MWEPPPDPHFTAFAALPRAVVGDRALMLDVGKRWRGWALIYLHLLVALVWLPVTAAKQLRLHQSVTQDAPLALERWQTLKISEGRLRMAADQPWTWGPDAEAPLLIVDTSGGTVDLEGRSERVLLTKHTLITDRGWTFAFVHLPDLYLDRETMEDWLGSVDLWFSVIFYPLAFSVSLTWRGLQVMGYGLIAWLLSRRRLGYSASVRLSVMAITPVMIVDMALRVAGWSSGLWWVLGPALSFAYLWRAIGMNLEGKGEGQVKP